MGLYLCEALKAATFAFFSATRFASRALSATDQSQGVLNKETVLDLLILSLLFLLTLQFATFQ